MQGVRAFKSVGAKLGEEDIRQFDIVHFHAIWNLEQHRVAALCRRLGVPYVIAPRGMLEPWSLRQGWLKKRIARFLFQDRDLKGAAALHATAASEVESFRKLGLGNAVIVSPNGVNLPETKVERSGGGKRRRALFVSRMHPKKGVLELIKAWRRVQGEAKVRGEGESWCLELVYTVRNEEERAYERACRELADGDAGIVFTGELDDEAKWAAYRRADFFVLPTYSENFGIVVAEALWAGVPVVTTKGTPWRELEETGCGWWIGTGTDPLADKLREVLALDDGTLRAMGRSGHRLVEEKYTWLAVCQTMIRGYEEILNAHRTHEV